MSAAACPFCGTADVYTPGGTSYPPTTPVPASERPTQVAIPRAPRVPTFAVPVEEVRYDLEHATAGAAYFGPPHLREAAAKGEFHPYAGLSSRESEALSQARCELIDRAERLGRR